MRTGWLLNKGFKEVLKLERCRPLPNIATCCLIKRLRKQVRFSQEGEEKEAIPGKNSYVVQYKDRSN